MKTTISQDMSVGDISPTVQDVVNKIFDVCKYTISNINTGSFEKILTSHIIGTNNNDMCSMTISFAINREPNNDNALNFFIIQNIKNADVCVIITSSESEGLKILFKSINKYPIVGIEKYLPNIINSTIAKLQ